MNISTDLKTRLTAVRIGLWLLGTIWLFAAVSKLYDYSQSVSSLFAYGIVSHQKTFIIALLTLEAVLGMVCLSQIYVKLALIVSMSISAIFCMMTFIHRKTLQGASCGCFGRWSGSSPEVTVLHDLILFGASGVLLFYWVPDRFSFKRALRAVALSGGVIITGFLISPSLLPTSKSQPDEVEVLLSAECPHCRDSVPKVRHLSTANLKERVVIYVGASNAKEIEAFWHDGAAPAFVPLTLRQLGKLTSQLPVVYVLRNGHVSKSWIGVIPTPEALRAIEAEAPPSSPK